MNKIVYDLLLKLEQCDDRHNRCDYLMEHDEITYLLEHIEEKDKKIERLKNGYCELKVKCNNGECDCTNEEYDGMVESNIKLSLEVERLNNIINELEKWLNTQMRLVFLNEAGHYKLVLDKLKELKEGKDNGRKI